MAHWVGQHGLLFICEMYSDFKNEKDIKRENILICEMW